MISITKTVKSKVETDADLHYQSHKLFSVHTCPACIIVISYYGPAVTEEFCVVKSDSSKLTDTLY